MILHFNFLKLFLLITLIYYLLPEINAKIVVTKYETKINRRSLSIDDKIKNTTTEDESLTTDFTTYNTEDETTTSTTTSTTTENETSTTTVMPTDKGDECGSKVNKSCVNKCCNKGKCVDHFLNK